MHSKQSLVMKLNKVLENVTLNQPQYSSSQIRILDLKPNGLGNRKRH